MQMVIGGWVSKTISEITQLHVPDLVKKHGPSTALELVERHGVRAHAPSLQRALRACASLGLFTEDAESRYGPTPLSDALTADSPVSIKAITEIFGRSWYTVWGGLGDALRSGEPQPKSRLGAEYWDFLRSNPKEMEEFGAAMKANSNGSLRGVLELWDFTGVKTVADVGGGFGHLALALLAKYPELRATVLDMPDLEPIVRAQLPSDPGVTVRFTYQGGEMFADVPAAEVYVMKHIIHDWDDERCVALLQHCVRRMQGDGRVLCVDAVLPPAGDTSGTAAKLLDINMLVFIPGKERTLAEWTDPYRAAGLRVGHVLPIRDNFGTSIVEGVRA